MTSSIAPTSATADTNLHVLIREKTRFCVTQFPCLEGREASENLPLPKEAVYLPTGSCFATIEGEHHAVVIRDGTTGQFKISFGGLEDQSTPLKVTYVAFSPKGTYLLAWSRPVLNVPNLVAYDIATGQNIGSFFHKTFDSDFWTVQWSDDESIAVKSVTNTLHFFAGNDLTKPVQKLGIPGVTKFAMSHGSAPYSLAVFVAGKSGAPGRFAMYTHPDQGGEQLQNRSAFKAETVDFKWNSRGTALLALSSTNVDSSGKSYYGQSEVYFMNKRGSVCKRVELPQEGPTYDAKWSPTGDHFIIIYGFMPARATLFDDRCDPVFDFGTGSWNTIIFSPHGRYVALGGFGSLAGRVEFWDSLKHHVVGRVELPCTTAYSWSPCSRYFLSATTYPRLREANGYKIARIDGQIIHHVDMNETHLYQAELRPGDASSFPDPLTVSGNMIGGPMQKPGGKNAFNSSNGVKKGGVYRPPGSRGAAASFSLHDHVKAGKVDKATFMSGGKPAQRTVTASGKKIVPGMDPVDAENSKPSKSALKRKKKKEKERLAEIENQKEPAQVPVLAETAVEVPQFENVAAAEKRIKALTKKLRQITSLKEMREGGKELKDEQITKLNTEPMVQAELDAVTKLIAEGKLTE